MQVALKTCNKSEDFIIGFNGLMGQGKELGLAELDLKAFKAEL